MTIPAWLVCSWEGLEVWLLHFTPFSISREIISVKKKSCYWSLPGITTPRLVKATPRCHHEISARWCSGLSDRIVVSRPGVHSLGRVIPKDFKNGIRSFPTWCSALKWDGVENKPASLLVVSLGKALNGTPPPLCGRQVAYQYFTGLQL